MADRPPVAESLGPPAARFLATESERVDLGRSWAIETPPAFRLPPDPAFAPVPTFSRIDRWHQATIDARPADHLLGLGPTPGPLRRNGLVTNADSGDPDAAVHDAIVIALAPDGSAFAAIADTPHPVHVDLTHGIHFRSKHPFAVVVIRAATLSQLLTHLAELTGRPELPPRWAIDLILSPPETTAAGIDAAIALADTLPVRPGSIWIAHAPPLPASDWPGPSLPDWPALRQRLDPAHLKPLATLALDRLDPDLLAAAQRGDILRAGVPIPDFDRPQVRQWWSLNVSRARALGISGLILPPIPNADPSHNAPFDPHAHRSLLFQHARASYEGIGGEASGQRAVLISPTLGVGSVRAGARWLAPDAADDPRAALRAAISSALAGQPLIAANLPDVADDRSLQRRWLATLGTLPLLHARTPTTPEASADLAEMLRLRAALAPYLYTQLFFAFFRCEPPIRPVMDLDPADPSLLDLDSAFLLGRDLLIATDPADHRLNAALSRPGLTGWKRLDVDPDRPWPDWVPSVFIRPGSIVPLALPTDRRTPSSPALNAVVLIANLPESAPAQPNPGTPAALGRLYEDIGEGHDFMKNAGRIITYRIDLQGDRAMLRLAGLDGGWSLPRRPVIARVLHRGLTLTALGSEAGTIAIPLGTAGPQPARNP